MYIRRKVFSILKDENGEEKLFSTTEVEIQKEFANKDEAYGDIDEQAPDDPYYHKGFEKWGKRVAIGGGAATAVGGTVAALNAKKGIKGQDIIDKASAAERDHLHSKKYYKNVKEMHESAAKNAGPGKKMFEEKAKEAAEKFTSHAKKAEAAGNAVKKATKKYGKNIKLLAGGQKVASLGTTAAIIGGGLYVGSKLGNNARKAQKKDLKDVLVQSKESK